jgi:hypothetical protein
LLPQGACSRLLLTSSQQLKGSCVAPLLLLLPQGSLPVAAGGCLQLAPADISQRQTLSPEMFDGVRAVVSCTAVKVQPKEGDTVDRQKYYQVRCCS